jgi:putative phage-type endonuclease
MISDDDYNELECSIFEVLDHCYSNNIDYDLDDIIESFYNDISNIVNDDDYTIDIIEECIHSYFEIFVDKEDIEPVSSPIEDPLVKKLDRLREVVQPQQRTEEWYLFRHGMITASSVWKVLKSPASINSIIYEKCSPYSTKQIFSHSMEWGKKFEPLSTSLYEKRNSTKVGEFGCITHPQYPFLGASPDGINIDSSSPKFGTMIEVKNIVNRLITGKPKDEYWIQMQIQMEVCDLDHCDFVETRFKEYDSEDDYLADQLRENGVILEGYFLDDYTPHYHYIDNASSHLIQNIIETHQYTYHKIIYWYLDEYSCIPIERDREWFKGAIPKIQETWNTILLEKETGYEHRKPKQRVVKSVPHSDLFDKEDEHKIIVEKLE